MTTALSDSLSTEYRERLDWQSTIEACDLADAEVDALIDSLANDTAEMNAAFDFADDAQQRIATIRRWVTQSKTATAAQMHTINSIREWVKKWSK